MKYLLPLLILTSRQIIQGVLEWKVIGKITNYGQNVTLFCNVPNCCPEVSGWDRWTPEQRTLFIDVKTGRPNKKYDGNALKDGYTLIIQNLTKQDLNVSYSCLYGVTLGERKFLLEEDVFTYVNASKPIMSTGNSFSRREIAGIIVGVLVPVVAAVIFLFIHFWRQRQSINRKNVNSVLGAVESSPLVEMTSETMDEGISYMDIIERDKMKKAIQSGTEIRQYVRIQVIGKDRVGKTSLVRTLLGQQFNEKEESTDGIDIFRSCQIRTNDDQWMVGEDKTESEKMRRIMHAVQKRHIKRKISVPDQQLPFKEYSSEKDKMLNGQEQVLSNKQIPIITETLDGDTEHTINVSTALNNSSDDLADLTAKANRVQPPDSCIISHVTMSSDKTDPKATELTEKILENMDTIIMKVRNEREKMTSEGLVECGFWDFAGQKEYYATHQTFFTPHAIYLLVADIGDDIKDTKHETNFSSIGENLGFWLDSIHCYCKDQSENLCPPVILVFTGTDKVDKVEEMKQKNKFFEIFGLQKKIKHTRSICFISNKHPDEKEINLLKNEISKIAKDMEYFAEERPTRWLNLENTLEVVKNLQKNVPVLARKYVETLADKNSIHGEELLLFLNYQHKIGNIIFFADIPDYIILEPNWLVKCFRCLVCDDGKIGKTVTERYELTREGKLSDKLIDELFSKEPDLNFGEYKTLIFEVLKKFDIIVELPLLNISSYYMPCMIEKQTSLSDIKMSFNVKDSNHSECTPWLVFEFKFLPIAYNNHILVSYIRNYNVCKVKSGDTEGEAQPAIYAGKVVVYLDDTKTRQLIICFSRNAISLQVWKRRVMEDKTYKKIIQELISKIAELEKKFTHNISFEIKAKCSHGDYSDSSGRVTCEDLNQLCDGEREYLCAEHNCFHRKEDIENIWLKHDEKGKTDEVVKSKTKKKKRKDRTDKYGNQVSQTATTVYHQEYHGPVDTDFIDCDIVKQETIEVTKVETTKRAIHNFETMNVLSEVEKSVGHIIGPKENGTCWRVGYDKIITAAHVVGNNIWDDMNGILFEPDLRKFRVDFKYISKESSSQFKVLPKLLFNDKSLDIAVLQLESDEKNPFPPPLKMFHVLNREKDGDIQIYLISHNQSKKKEVNSGIGIWKPTEKRLQDLEKFCQEYGEENGYKGLERKDRLVIRCDFVGGAPGSPGIVILNNVAYVVLVYIRGFPSFYHNYQFSEEQKRTFPKDKLFQHGVNIGSLFATMSSGKYVVLRNEIFPEEALKFEQTINQHKLAISGDKTSSNTETTETSTGIVKGKTDNISAKSDMKIPISCTDQSEDNIPDTANYNRLMSHNSVPGQTFITSPEEDTDRYNNTSTGNQSDQDIKTGGSDKSTVQDQGNHTHPSKDNVAVENHNLHTKEGEIISLQRSPGNTRPVSAEQISIDEWVGHEWQEHRYKQLQDNDLLLLSKAIHPESLNSVAIHFNLNQMDVEEIRTKQPTDLCCQMLYKWKNKNGEEATLGKLIQNLFSSWITENKSVEKEELKFAISKVTMVSNEETAP